MGFRNEVGSQDIWFGVPERSLLYYGLPTCPDSIGETHAH